MDQFSAFEAVSNLSAVRVLGVGVVSGATFGVVFSCVLELLNGES